MAIVTPTTTSTNKSVLAQRASIPPHVWKYGRWTFLVLAIVIGVSVIVGHIRSAYESTSSTQATATAAQPVQPAAEMTSVQPAPQPVVDAAQATGCKANARCTPHAGEIIAATTGAHNSLCHDATMWEHLDEVGLQVSNDGVNFRPYPCTLDSRLNRTCNVVSTYERFVPKKAGVQLPNFWYVELGADCGS